MGISKPETLPNLVYLNKDELDNILVYRFQGRVKNVVQNISEKKGVSGEVGAGTDVPLVGRLKAAISAHYEDGEEIEFVKEVDDPIAKFALVMEVFEDSDSITEINMGTSLENVGFSSGDLVAIHGGITKTPFRELSEWLDSAGSMAQQMQDGLDMVEGTSFIPEETREELDSLRDDMEGMSSAIEGMDKMITAFSRKEDVYRVKPNPDTNTEFVTTLEEEWFENRPIDFPRTSGDYLILGKVATEFEEKVELINFSQFISSEEPHKEKVEIRRKRREFADTATDITGRNVNPSEFSISEGDIQIIPLAIY